MNEEQSFNIPLDSPLDVNLGDQLVKVTSPKFTYDRQRFMGGLSQTSVRYEDNGYFAGWWRHQFELVSMGENRMIPSFGGDDEAEAIAHDARYLLIQPRVNTRGARFFTVDERSIGLSVSFAPEDWSQWVTGSGSFARDPNDPDYVIVSGVTRLGVPFTVYVNAYTGEVVSRTLDPNFYVKSDVADYMLHLLVDREPVVGDDWLLLRKNRSLYVNGSLMGYRADAEHSYWGETLRNTAGEFVMDHATRRVSATNEFEVVRQTLQGRHGTVDEQTVVDARDKTVCELQSTISYDEKWSGVSFDKAEPVTDTIGGATVNDAINLQKVSVIRANDEYIDVLHKLPIWLHYSFSGVRIFFWNLYSESKFLSYISNTIDQTQSVLIPCFMAISDYILPSHYKFAVDFRLNIVTNNGSMYYDPNSFVTSLTDGDNTVTTTNRRYLDCQFRIRTLDPMLGLPASQVVAYITLRFSHDKCVNARQELLDCLESITVETPIDTQHFMPYKIVITDNFDRIVRINRVLYSNTTYFYSIDADIAIDFTQCVYGILAYRVMLSNALNSDANAFSLRKLMNTEINAAYNASSLLRIDGGADGERLDTLLNSNLVQASIADLSQGNAQDARILKVVLNSVDRNRPLYYALEQSVTTDNYGNTVEVPNIFPIGLLTGDPYATTDQIAPVLASRAANTVANITLTVKTSKYISQVSQVLSWDRTPYNANLLDALSPSFEVLEPIEAGRTTYTLRVFFDSTRFVDYRYNIETGFENLPINISLDSASDDGYTYVSSTVPAVKSSVQRIVTKFNVRKLITLTFRRTMIALVHGFVLPTTVLRQDRDKVYLSNDYGFIDLATHSLQDSPVIAFANVKSVGDDTYEYFVTERNAAEVRIMPRGLISRDKEYPKFVALHETSTHYELRLKFDEALEYRTVYVDKNVKLNLLYETKDVRDNFDPKFVYQNDLNGIKLFIRQHWSDTVLTENFWWIDSKHVLELRRDDIILWKKVPNEIDDWNGDKWQVTPELVGDTQLEKQVPRHMFFGITDVYYAVSSTRNGTPALFKLRPTATSIEILYIDDVLNATFNTMTEDGDQWQRASVDIYRVDFGEALAQDAITAYVDLNPAAIVSASKITSTVIDGVLMIGIAHSRGLLQWTLRVDGATVDVVNGYGCVGLDGSLTGGQLPTYSCGPNGFESPVFGIETLSDVKGFDVTNDADRSPTVPPTICVGTGSTVWFITKQVDSIVSHYVYDVAARAHRPVSLTLTNSVERRYESASFSAAGLFDLLTPPITFSTLFESVFNLSPAMKIIADVILPALFVIDLKYVIMTYVNHSFGQYAYVWRNSAKDHLPEGKTDQDVKFLQDKYTLTQSQATILGQSGEALSAWINIILKAVEFADALPVEYKANRAQNQTTTDDSKGRKFSQFFTDAVADTVGDLLVSSGFNNTVKSTLGQAYTLDMFYSISEKSQCWAGPGFVNHDFIGQCVAQSVTDTQLSGKRVGYWVTLKTLSEVVVSFKIDVMMAVQRLLLELAGAIGNTTLNLIGTSIPIGMILATALNVAAGLLDALIIVNQEGLKVIGQLADAIGPSTGKAYAAGMLQKYDLSVEGTHTYGNKPMSFFWPAYGVQKPVRYTDERVIAEGKANSQEVSFTGRLHKVLFNNIPSWSKGFSNDAFFSSKKLPMDGPVKSVSVRCRGVSVEVNAPDKMAVVEGAKTFLSPELFKNEQIGVAPAVFPPPPIHDYVVDERWQLGFTAGAGEIMWVTCDDTKLIDGPPSNIVVLPDFCGVASSYVAIEIKDVYDHRYLRPWAVTPQAIALNLNKMNCVHDTKVYHAFDGQGNRIVKWAGGSGMDKAVLYQQYLFQVNDHFKRSNILPPSQFFGIFDGPPTVAMRSLAPGEPVANIVQSLIKGTGVEIEIPGEQKNLQRFAIPVFSRQLSTLPAVVRMLAPYALNVVEGITSLTTGVRTTQTRYKAPSSIDFNIYSETYRATDEFLCKLTTKDGIVAVQDVCATAGLRFIGATTREAFFYSPATRMYYAFSNGSEIQKVDVLNRFLDVMEGKWDYVNQEVVLKARNSDGAVMVCRLDHDFLGEIFPPNKTIYSDTSDYKILSMAGGTVFQGPKRFILNRFILLDYMTTDIRFYNRRQYNVLFPDEYDRKNWRRVSREYYDQERDYGWEYVDPIHIRLTRDGTILNSEAAWWAIHGWTHNPFGLVTAMLGIDDVTDCKFEWSITFAWTQQMEQLYEMNEYATVCLMAETVTQGGVMRSNATRLFLHKEMFTRTDGAGYYTFKFQSNNGIGNRERLYIWSDAVIAVQDLKLRCKEMTSSRTQPLITQVDIKDKTEF